MDQIRLGTIGSGMIVHGILDNVKKTEGITLEAVFSRDREKGRRLAEAYGCAKVYTDMDRFLYDPDISAVYIATPNLLHYQQAKRALLANKHVICEKPFVTRACQARELEKLAEERGLILLEMAPTPYLPNFEVLQRQLPRLGRIRLVQSNYSQYSSRYDALRHGEKPAIFDPAFGGGCLMDINFYNILLNVLLFGMPRNARYYANRYPGMADTSGTAVLEYEDFISSNTGAKDTWGVNFFQIEGEQGFLYITDGANGLRAVRVVTRDQDVLLNEQTNQDRWFYEVEAVTRILLERDLDAARARMKTTIDTVSLMETLRRDCGLLFPGDEGA